jgi:quercetin dioxygenase-like cupin family protein
MASYKLRLYDDRLGARAAAAALPAANRVLYVSEGMASLAAGGSAATLSANSAWFSAGETRVAAGPDGARVLRYELTGAAVAKGALDGEHAASELLLESTVELEPGDGYLMRCDRVDIPPGGIAWTHTHQGPGTRCLLQGGFTVETKGHRTEIAPGEAWFEAGPDPVLAWAPDDRPGYFSRVMILPRALKGKSSIRYVRPEDADKPKLQRYTIFIDEFITL